MKITDYILELFFPTRCAFCHKLTENGQTVCDKCRKELPYNRELEIKQNTPNISFAIAPLYYEGLVRDSLLRYKFHGLRGYSRIYAKILSKSIDEMGISCDIITWVPLSRKRLRKRGYDQARLIAEEISKELGIKCERLLIKTRNNPAQSGTGGPEKRRANVRGIYRAADPSHTEGKSVLIIDDIFTTGATLSECAGVLRRSGARICFGAAVACGRN